MRDRFELHLGDCLDVLRGMGDNSVDSIVTDPPYGLRFMGKRWDYDVPSVEIWAACLRVLKPGGHLLAFAGTRTQHRMAARIEDAGFEIRDMIAWVYGSGFPKSHNGPWGGTALKPALEPITMARKPLTGTVEANWSDFGTGALNIDGCRVHAHDSQGYAYTVQRMAPGADQNRTGKTHQESIEFKGQTKDDRWPANLIHDGSDEVLAAFPDAKGQQGNLKETGRAPIVRPVRRYGTAARVESDTSAARFFYCAKASRADRNAGLVHGGGPAVSTGATMRDVENADWAQRNGNHHPTVKPTELMRYLCRLVTPPSGLVLDPFMGSGSTGKAAMLEGFHFVGIERDAEYVEIARARITHAQAQRAELDAAPKQQSLPIGDAA
ncbi:site-specific DNA-methyltransferase [Stenotrophomonas sp. PS02297]|uniref:DNA-methyltransferase n=1 Tax=Stenotrophomonas sp. PS02297 TaxID=2991423 RepID=UPI00249A9CF1|nr:site-specific DNA-methyltransferase [Stenotrophomonas sp. PS02297]